MGKLGGGGHIPKSLPFLQSLVERISYLPHTVSTGKVCVGFHNFRNDITTLAHDSLLLNIE